MFGSRRKNSGKPVRGDLDGYVAGALAELRNAVAHRQETHQLIVRPGEAGPGSLGMVIGQVAQKIQDAGYIIDVADTAGQAAYVNVRIPLAFIEGERPVP